VEVWLTDEALTEGEKAVGVCRQLNCTDREMALNVFYTMTKMQERMRLAAPPSEIVQ